LRIAIGVVLALAVVGLVCAGCLAGPRQSAGAQPITVQAPSPNPSPASNSKTPTSPVVPSSRVDRSAPFGGSSTAPLPGDWSQLFPGLVGTFVGALLALWTAFWLDRVSRRRAQASERAARANRLMEALELIGRELEWNSREIKAILTDLDSRLRTDRAPMSDAWNAVGTEAMKAGGAVAVSLSEAYALLGRCGRLLAQYASEVAEGGPGLRTAREQILPRLRELMEETGAALEVAQRRLRGEQLSTP
jgi:hypothetical protein